MPIAVKLVIAGLGAAFIAVTTAGFLYIMFWKSFGQLATLMGGSLGLYLFLNVRRSILKRQ